MFTATIANTKVTTELDDKTNRLTAKISFDCGTNPDALMELDMLRLKGKTLEVNIFTSQVEFGKKPDVPVSTGKEDPLWNAGDKPGAAANLLGSQTPADQAKALLANPPKEPPALGKKKGKEPPVNKPVNKTGQTGASGVGKVDYPPEPPLV